MKRERRTTQQKLRRLQKALRVIAAYPPEGHDRRTDEGYPAEFTYDEFAYKRIVDSFRKAILQAVEESAAPW